MTKLSIRQISKCIGDVEILHDVSLDIAEGEFCVLVGPSGSGKSTLLRTIAGLDPVSTGSIWMGERDVTRLAPKARDVAMVFQSYALYPQMTVRENMGFGLRLAKVSKHDVARRVDAVAQTLALGPLMERRPGALSGGQRQRVAMGRAMVREPAVFLFDEPLSNLDAALRTQVRSEIRDLHRRLKTTSVYVTHDQIEAMTMGDKIAVLREGKVEQVGSPVELYERPANRFVAGFMGSPSMNFLQLPTQLEQDRVYGLWGDQRIGLPSDAVGLSAPTVTAGVRPEHVRLGPAQGKQLTCGAEVTAVEFTGGASQIFVNTAAGPMVLTTEGRVDAQVGQYLPLAIHPQHLHFFHPSTGVRWGNN